ncbi:outer membrane lipoprotein-sorting protein, partial [Vibrio sp. 10N.286.49.E1]
VDSQQVTEMIAKADSYRLDNDKASKVVSLVTLYQNDQLDKTREYNVYTRPNRESLVVFKSAVEAGQKMLMIEDNY